MYLELERNREAEDLYLRATQADPNFGDGHYNLGRLYLKEGDPTAAARSLERAVELQPGVAEGYFQLGHARAMQWEMDLAALAYRRSCDLQPSEAAHCYNLGEVLLSLGHSVPAGTPAAADRLFAEARQAYGRAAAVDPRYRKVQERLEYLANRTGGGAP